MTDSVGNGCETAYLAEVIGAYTEKVPKTPVWDWT